jgi:hypothetical protein
MYTKTLGGVWYYLFVDTPRALPHLGPRVVLFLPHMQNPYTYTYIYTYTYT